MQLKARQRSVFNHDRFFVVKSKEPIFSGWYCETREGIRGPFPARHIAEIDLARLIRVAALRRRRALAGDTDPPRDDPPPRPYPARRLAPPSARFRR